MLFLLNDYDLLNVSKFNETQQISLNYQILSFSRLQRFGAKRKPGRQKQQTTLMGGTHCSAVVSPSTERPAQFGD